MTAATAPIVTLVTPTYNQSATLAATLDSVLAQTYPAIDYRVIDDGSTDATPEVLARYTGRLAWERQANRGQAATLNAAWERGRGKYLTFLSSDDLLVPQAIEKLVALLESDPGIACAYPDCDLIDGRGRVLARGVCGPFDLERLVIDQINPLGPGQVFRADAFRAIGGWRTDVVLGVDRDFWMRMARVGHIRFLPEHLASFRVHPGSISRMPSTAVRADDLLTVLRDYFAGPDVPSHIRVRETEAYASAHREIAGRLLRAGRPRGAWRHRRLAHALVAAAVPRAPSDLATPVRARLSLPTRLRILRAALLG